VLAAARDSHALEYAAEDLLSDPKMMLAAIAKDPTGMSFAAPSLQADRVFVLNAISILSMGAVSFQIIAANCPHLSADRDFVLAAVAVNPWFLLVTPPELQADRELLRAAAAKDLRVLRWVDTRYWCRLAVDRGLWQVAFTRLSRGGGLGSVEGA